jgi:hypothetical protein
MGSDFLFAMPSLLSGLARTIDLGSTFDSYNVSRTPEEADRRALVADWKSTGQDLEKAMRTHEAEHPVHPRQPSQMALALGER